MGGGHVCLQHGLCSQPEWDRRWHQARLGRARITNKCICQFESRNSGPRPVSRGGHQANHASVPFTPPQPREVGVESGRGRGMTMTSYHPEITTRHESRHLSRQIRGQERQMQRDTFVKYFSLGRAHCLKNYLSPSFSRMARMDPGVELSVSIFQNAVYFQSVNSIISLCPDCVLLCIFEYLLFHFSEF